MRPIAFLLCILPVSAFALTVRPDRPRLLLSNGMGRGTSLATFKQRCTADPAYMSRCQNAFNAGGGSWPAINQAAASLVTGDAAKCVAAFNTVMMASSDTPGQPDPHSFISNNGRTMEQLAVVRDWCDGALDGNSKAQLEARITSFADWYLANSAGLDVYHDDMPNVWNAIALAGLALKGTAADAKAQVYLDAADKQWKTVILPAMAYAGDWWHEGFVYVQPSLGGLAWYATAWTIATDDDVYQWAKANANDLFNGYLYFHAYAMRPDYNYVYIGDTTDNKQSIELFSRWLIDMLTLGTQSPLGQALSIEIKANSRPGYDYSGSDGYLPALLYDNTKDGAATPRSSLPTARWHGRGANDVAVLRSGWGKDDTFVFLSCGDYFGAHQHDEAGSFQIFRHSMLSGSTGYYDNFDSDHWANYYSQHSVHANTIAVYSPNEFFPTTLSLNNPSANVNDGGQRVLRRDNKGSAYPNPDLPTYLKNKTSGTRYETGDVKTFEHGQCHDYVACDVTAAYDSTVAATNGNAAKVSEVTRQFVFLRPELLVVFDRVEATQASYDKRFLLHGAQAPTANGNDFTITNGPGRLLGRVLLPASADVNVVTNFSVAGTPHPPQQSGSESGGARLEISPKQEQLRDYFLVLLDATAPSKAALPTATVMEDAASATITVDDGAQTYTVTFAKTGALGGHLTVKKDGGAVVCDQALGMNATGPADMAISPSDGGSPSSGDAASNADGGGNTLKGGCACNLGAPIAIRIPIAIPLLLFALYFVSRNSRSTRGRSAGRMS